MKVFYVASEIFLSYFMQWQHLEINLLCCSK